MHERLIYHYVVDRLRTMTDAQLEAVRRDCLFVCEQAMKVVEQQTGRPFEEVFEERLAGQLRSDPQALPQLQRLLAERQQPRRKRDRDEYFEEAWANRDVAEDRWRAITDKIAKVQFPRCPSWKIERPLACAELPKLPGVRVAELIAYAELHAGCRHMGDWREPLEAHLREQKIDDIASFITRLCDPWLGQRSHWRRLSVRGLRRSSRLVKPLRPRSCQRAAASIPPSRRGIQTRARSDAASSRTRRQPPS
jgi:hypothetical protein